MSHPASSAQALIETYIRAKDENRPHRMAAAFAADAQLRMTVKTEAIAFPAATEGLAQISDVLVRRFGQRYDNVYTFCLGTPPAPDADAFTCAWLVGMSDKDSGGVRGLRQLRLALRHGRASPRAVAGDRHRGDGDPIAPEAAHDVLDGWLARLPYPWCGAAQARARAPALDGLAPVLQFLAAVGA